MILPNIEGNFPNYDTIFFISADDNYFNLYGKILINSIRQHFSYPIHFHLYNPSENTKKFCNTNNISFTYEFFNQNLVDEAFNIYKNPIQDLEFSRRRSKMIKIGENIEKIHYELVRTYYACTRFIRLDQLLKKPTYVIMLDTDSLVRKFFSLPKSNYDIHIFEKTHKKHVPYKQHLASTIFYTGTHASRQLIRDHAKLILKEYEKNTFYWFLDQETLDLSIQKYRKNPLSQEFVDFDMNVDSYIWCAKGKRKFEEEWIKESVKYQTL